LKYIAIDIGMKNCVVCIMDSDGTIIDETTYHNTLADAESFAKQMIQQHGTCTAVCESTGNLWIKTCQAFERNGIPVQLANPVKTRAIAEYKAHRPHVTIMDIMMSNVEGIQTINEIMKNDPKAKIIVCSTRDNKEIIYTSIKSGGAKDYLIKPFNTGDVIMAVSKQLVENRGYSRSSTSAKQIQKLKTMT